MTLEVLVLDKRNSSTIAEYLNKAFKEKASFASAFYLQNIDSILKGKKYDAVILGDMPVESGNSIAKKIKSEYSDMKLIGFSTRWTDENAKTAELDIYSYHLEKIKDYISKLFNK